LAGLLVVHPAAGTVLEGTYISRTIEGIGGNLQEVRPAGTASRTTAVGFGFSEHLLFPISQAGEGIVVLELIILQLGADRLQSGGQGSKVRLG
jgi:hypothetical protein